MPAGAEPGQPTSPKNVGANFFRSGADGQIDIGWMQQLAYVDLSKEVAVLGSSTERRAFKREATPLIDLLPPVRKNTFPAISTSSTRHRAAPGNQPGRCTVRY